MEYGIILCVKNGTICFWEGCLVKKCLYYTSPFIFVPFIVLLCEHLDNVNLINMSPNLLIIVLALISFVIANLTPTHKNLDYIITVVMPLSFFCTMFIGGFLDRGCSGHPELSLVDAFEAAFQPWCLSAYCIMSLIALCASFKPIRIVKRFKSQ